MSDPTKWPTLHVKTHAELDKVNEWAELQGINTVDFDILPFVGIDIYVQPPDYMNWLNHPDGMSNRALTSVNSLTHLKHYVRRYQVR